MKKRVLIVEDDKFFRIAVKKYIDWGKYGFEIAGEAVHGKAALEFMESHAVEVVVTDMSMPIMNGVELTREVKKRCPDTMCIALSAYDDFEFVKESLKAGASDYILKQDIEKESVGHTIAHAWKKHLADMAFESNMKEGIQRYLRGGQSESERRAENYLRLCIEEGQGVYLCVIQNLNEEWVHPYCEKSVWMEESILELHDKKWHCFLIPSRQSLSFMQQFQEKNEMLNQISAILEKEKYLASCSGLAFKAENLRDCFLQTQQALEVAGFLNKKKIVLWEEICDVKRQFHFLKAKEFSKDVVSLPDAEKSLEALTEELRKVLPDAEHVQKNYLQWLSEVAANMQKDIGNQKYAEIKEKLENTVLLDEKHRLMGTYLEELFAEENGTSLHVSVISSMQFIQRNYAEDLSLSQIADYAAMNESYLSNLFRKETGQSITEYLSHIRIEKAKELVRETNYKNYEIGEKVGFVNASYFSTIFKKETGLTIQEYRKQNRRT